ncbi:MAG: ABC transporter permease subunit, partial [Acidaminobacteraceae bacterium]
RKYEIAARIMGASELKIFFKISIPMGLQKILSGIILTFSRSLGEFGATLMVAGNIPGKTQTLPIALYFAAEAGDQATANKLLIFILVLSFSVIFLLNYFSKEDQYA